MTTKLGRSLPISLRSMSRPSLRPASIYTWRNEPRGRIRGSEKSSKNNSFSECIVPLPCSEFLNRSFSNDEDSVVPELVDFLIASV